MTAKRVWLVAYMDYLDTLPEEQQTQHIAENIKQTLRKEHMNQSKRTPQYKAKCHDCGKTYQTQNINTIDQWCETHQTQICQNPNGLIEIWETHR